MSDVPVIKSNVTYLELFSIRDCQSIEIEGYNVELISKPNADEYINLYREIGRNYIWNYRPSQSREEIETLISSENTKIYYLKNDLNIVGMAECDVSDPENIEVVHFGLIPTAINKGLGKDFFAKILFLLAQNNPKRIFLSTCGLDHPKAASFYQSAGFKIFKTSTAEFKDYRYSDFYNMDDAPQIPHGVEKYP